MLLSSAAALLTGSIAALLGRKGLAITDSSSTPQPASKTPSTQDLPHTPVVTPNGSTLPWKLDNGVKVFHLIAEPVKREFAPGMIVNCWGYNGQTPGPTIEAVEGDRVRIRIANLSMDSHPIHIHGYNFKITGTDGGKIPPAAQWPETTVNVHPGSTRDIEFAANAPGDWAFHCHKTHHTMNAMSHNIPNMLGVKQHAVERKIRNLLPDYMAMGERGMAEMADMNMPLPGNTLPMMMGDGPFGNIEMGGMFTVVKVREDITGYDDPGWYQYPRGTVAWPVAELP